MLQILWDAVVYVAQITFSVLVVTFVAAVCIIMLDELFKEENLNG